MDVFLPKFGNLESDTAESSRLAGTPGFSSRVRFGESGLFKTCWLCQMDLGRFRSWFHV